MKLIVGLGNPGEKYADTRHNLGFKVVEEYAKKHRTDLSWTKEAKFKSLILKASKDLWLVKPQTYMNNSGLAVGEIARYFKISLEEIIVIHDELDLPLGKIKVRLGGAAAGHHGVESIIFNLKEDKFIRLRLGIGNVRTKIAEHGGNHLDINNYVTSAFDSTEKPKIKHLLKQALKAVELLIEKGIIETQNQFN